MRPGQAYAALNQPREALLELDQVEKTDRAVLATNSNTGDTVGDLAVTLFTRGDVLSKQGDVQAALKAYAESIRLFTTVKARAESRRYLAMTHEHAGDAERQLAHVVAAPAANQEHQRAACRHYQQGLDALQSQSDRRRFSRGRGDPGPLREAGRLRACARSLAVCARVIAMLQAARCSKSICGREIGGL